jgi:hypothetical protein
LALRITFFYKICCFFKTLQLLLLFVTGLGEPLGGLEADVREVDVFNDSRFDQSSERFVVSR